MLYIYILDRFEVNPEFKDMPVTPSATCNISCHISTVDPFLVSTNQHPLRLGSLSSGPCLQLTKSLRRLNTIKCTNKHNYCDRYNYLLPCSPFMNYSFGS